MQEEMLAGQLHIGISDPGPEHFVKRAEGPDPGCFNPICASSKGDYFLCTVDIGHPYQVMIRWRKW